MRKSLVLVAVAVLALPLGAVAVAAENQETPHKQTEKEGVTHVKGTITKMDGHTLTVDGKEVKFNDKTEIVQKKKVVTADALKVGEKISARIKDGVATRIEISGKGEKGEHPKEQAPAEAK